MKRAKTTKKQAQEWLERWWWWILKECRSRYNGDGEDVAALVATRIIERNYPCVYKKLVNDLIAEAARDLRLGESRPHPQWDGWCIITPRREHTQERLALQNTDDEELNIVERLDEKEKFRWIRKIQRLQTLGYTDTEIIELLTPAAQRRKAELIKAQWGGNGKKNGNGNGKLF